MSRTVIELIAFSVDGKLRDGAPVEETRMGLFSALPSAQRWLRSATGKERVRWIGEDVSLLYFVAARIPVDAAEESSRTWVLDSRRKIVGEIPFVGEGKPERWLGRPMSAQRFRPGELVGFVQGDHYRVGIVNAGPPTPTRARRMWCDATDDAYLVDLVEPERPEDPFPHEHVPDVLLFRVRHSVPARLRKALRRRLDAASKRKT